MLPPAAAAAGSPLGYAFSDAAIIADLRPRYLGLRRLSTACQIHDARDLMLVTYFAMTRVY